MSRKPSKHRKAKRAQREVREARNGRQCLTVDIETRCCLGDSHIDQQTLVYAMGSGLPVITKMVGDLLHGYGMPRDITTFDVLDTGKKGRGA